MNQNFNLNWGGVASPEIMPDMNAINGVSSNGLSYMQGMGSPETGGGFFDDFLGQNGWGNLALGGANSLMNGWLGMQQLGMAKDRLKENKRQFNMNWGAQKNLTNSRLRDRQQARNASSGSGAYQSVGSYMKQNGVQ